MGTQAGRTVFDTILRIPEVTSAAISKGIQRAEAEQAVESIWVHMLMAGEVFTGLVLKKSVILHRCHLSFGYGI